MENTAIILSGELKLTLSKWKDAITGNPLLKEILPDSKECGLCNNNKDNKNCTFQPSVVICSNMISGLNSSEIRELIDYKVQIFKEHQELENNH